MVPGSRQRRFGYYHDPHYTRRPLFASPLLLSMRSDSSGAKAPGCCFRLRPPLRRQRLRVPLCATGGQWPVNLKGLDERTR
jgi:hypothetical protein